MNCFRILHRALVGIAASTVLASCAGPEIVSSVSRPGKFNLYNCDQLNKRGADLVKRENELKVLMEKARRGPGGEIAIALAYQNEFNIVEGDLREVEMSGTRKSCVLKHRSVSDQVVR